MKIGVMFGNPETTTGGQALKFYASVRLDIRRIGAIKDRDQVIGNQTRVKVVKNKMAPPFKVVDFDIMYGEGISKRGELIDLGVQAGVVEKSGSWFSHDGQRIGQGRENAKLYLKDHPEIGDADRARDPRQCRPRRRRDDGRARRYCRRGVGAGIVRPARCPHSRSEADEPANARAATEARCPIVLRPPGLRSTKSSTASNPLSIRRWRPLAATAWVTAGAGALCQPARRPRAAARRPGDRWSEAAFDCAWFLLYRHGARCAAGQDVVLLVDISGEGCVVDEEGRPVLGLTSVHSAATPPHGGPGKRVVPVRAPAVGGEGVEIWVEAGANDLFGVRRDNGKLSEAVIARRNPQLFALQYDFEVLHELMQLLPATSARAAALREALFGAAGSLRDFTDAEAARARAILAPVLTMRGGDPSLTISAVGHAHMDLAWLWPIRETIRKCGRTFATTLDLMERYPAYVFGASQPQQYHWVKERYPEPLRADQAARRRRALGGPGRDVGRARHEPAGGRVADPPDPLRQALLPRGIRARSRLPVGPGRLRLYGRPAADPGEVGRRPIS